MLDRQPVLDSLRPVIEQSRDVHTHVDKIVEVAGWMAYEELPMPEMAVPVRPCERSCCGHGFHHGFHDDRFGIHGFQDACEIRGGLRRRTASLRFRCDGGLPEASHGQRHSNPRRQIPRRPHSAADGKDFRGQYRNAHARREIAELSRGGESARGTLRRLLSQFHQILPSESSTTTARAWSTAGYKNSRASTM